MVTPSICPVVNFRLSYPRHLIIPVLAFDGVVPGEAVCGAILPNDAPLYVACPNHNGDAVVGSLSEKPECHIHIFASIRKEFETFISLE